MRHQIGFDYSTAIADRKTKKELPLIGRLQRKVDIDVLQKEMGELLNRLKGLPKDFATLDPASSEHNYHLKTSRGESFIENYDEFYSQYSIIGFQELSDAAKAHASGLNFSVDQLTPSMRLRGMKNTSFEKYHPHYDERNYTRPTSFYQGAVQNLLEGFQCEASRSALVCLRPKQYISPHFDIGPEYITRTMVPVFTNKDAVVGVRANGGYYEFHLPSDGGIYFINSGFEHYAINGGDEPRYQIRVCLNGQEDLQGMSAVEPTRFVSDEEFKSHPCAPAPPKESPTENILKQTLQEFNMEKSGKARLN